MEWQENKLMFSIFNFLKIKTVIVLIFYVMCMQNLSVVSGTKYGHCGLVSFLLKMTLN